MIKYARMGKHARPARRALYRRHLNLMQDEPDDSLSTGMLRYARSLAGSLGSCTFSC